MDNSDRRTESRGQQDSNRRHETAPRCEICGNTLIWDGNDWEHFAIVTKDHDVRIAGLPAPSAVPESTAGEPISVESFYKEWIAAHPKMIGKTVYWEPGSSVSLFEFAEAYAEARAGAHPANTHDYGNNNICMKCGHSRGWVTEHSDWLCQGILASDAPQPEGKA
jgi:hypothetical protein